MTVSKAPSISPKASNERQANFLPEPIGHGNSGVQPYIFFLNSTDQQDIHTQTDSTLVKIILTTTPADFSMLPQSNPLNETQRLDSDTRSTTSRGGVPAGSIGMEMKYKYAVDRSRALQSGKVQGVEEYFSKILKVV